MRFQPPQPPPSLPPPPLPECNNAAQEEEGCCAEELFTEGGDAPARPSRRRSRTTTCCQKVSSSSSPPLQNSIEQQCLKTKDEEEGKEEAVKEESLKKKHFESIANESVPTTTKSIPTHTSLQKTTHSDQDLDNRTKCKDIVSQCTMPEGAGGGGFMGLGGGAGGGTGGGAKHKNSLEMLVCQSMSVLNPILNVVKQEEQQRQMEIQKQKKLQQQYDSTMVDQSSLAKKGVNNATSASLEIPGSEQDPALTSGEASEAEDQFQELPVVSSVPAEEEEEEEEEPKEDKKIILRPPAPRKPRAKRKRSTLASQWRRQRELQRAREANPDMAVTLVMDDDHLDNGSCASSEVTSEEDLSPAVPEQSSFSARISTFEAPFTPSGTLPPSEALSEAGFFLLEGSEGEDKDNVRCFQCGVVQFGWEPSEDPWLRHETNSPHCEFVRRKNSEKRLT